MTEAPPLADPERIAPARDRERVDRTLRGFLAESRRRYAANPHVEPLFDRASEFVLEGGKRLRPRLALASYRILRGEDHPHRSIWRAAASLELFHAFMLVHDDLIDGSLTRRDRPTLHEAIRLDLDGRPMLSADARKRSADLGLIGGDLLCALGMRMLGRSGLEGSTLSRAHRLVSEMLVETGLGEALDVLYDDCPLGRVTEAQVLDLYLRKTARYTVSGPLVLGATLAGADRDSLRALRRFGDLLGLAYQIANDLDGLSVSDLDAECPDLDGGKRTWVLTTAHHRLDDAGRRGMAVALAMPVGRERRERLLALIAASGAFEAAGERLSALRREAMEALRSGNLDPSRRAAFLGLVAFFGPSCEAAAFAAFAEEGAA